MEKWTHPVATEQFERERASAKGLGSAVREIFEPLGDVVLELPPREPMREPPRFD